LGAAVSANALRFMIIDEHPASETLSGGQHCKQCVVGELNDMGEPWRLDMAIDAMSTAQYNQFFNGVTGGSNWYKTGFEETSCDGTVNPTPPIYSWGCMSGCSNNNAASVCVDTGFS
jgi:hypothetical protein